MKHCEEWPMSHEHQHSVSVKRLGYFAQYFVTTRIIHIVI
jgi:hypothetical protein